MWQVRIFHSVPCSAVIVHCQLCCVLLLYNCPANWRLSCGLWFCGFLWFVGHQSSSEMIFVFQTDWNKSKIWAWKYPTPEPWLELASVSAQRWQYYMCTPNIKDPYFYVVFCHDKTPVFLLLKEHINQFSTNYEIASFTLLLSFKLIALV